MWSTVKAMLVSKKFLAAVMSGAVWAGGKLGLHLEASELYPVVIPHWAYIDGQGWADHGKAAAQIAADAATSLAPKAS